MKYRTRKVRKVCLFSITVAFCAFVVATQNAQAVPCGPAVLCDLDLDCEMILGVTCKKIISLESCNLCDPEKENKQSASGCAVRFVGTLGTCIVPAGGCGGIQCIPVNPAECDD